MAVHDAVHSLFTNQEHISHTPRPFLYSEGLRCSQCRNKTSNNTLCNTRWRRPDWSSRCVTPQNRAVAIQCGQLMKTRHCWQHSLRAQSGPLLVSSLMCFHPHGIQLFSIALSSSHLFLFLVFYLHASLVSYPLYEFSFLYFKVSRTCVTPSMWCRFGNLRLSGASFPTEMCSGSFKVSQWVLSGLFQRMETPPKPPANPLMGIAA